MDNKRFALLIDADNISANYIGYIIKELVEKHGTITYKRIYGDWTSTHATKWKEKLLEHSITPIQQFSNVAGKNATDSALIIDAMDILYTHNVDGFCIVSSDSDFTRLATRIRESGVIVVGMGEEKTPRSFRTACSIFTNLEVLGDDEKISEQAQQTAEINELSQENIVREIEYMVMEDRENGIISNLGGIGNRLINKYPEFDVRKYGYSLLSKFIEDIPQLTMKKNNNKISIFMVNGETYKEEVIGFVVELISENQDKDYELADLGQKIHNKFTNFNVKDFGYSKLSTFIKSIPSLEVKNNENKVKVVCLKRP